MFELQGNTLLVRAIALPEGFTQPGTALCGVVEDFNEDYFARADVDDTIAARVNAAWSRRESSEGVRIFFDPTRSHEAPYANDGISRYFVPTSAVLAIDTGAAAPREPERVIQGEKP